mgnify:FL=1
MDVVRVLQGIQDVHETPVAVAWVVVGWMAPVMVHGSYLLAVFRAHSSTTSVVLLRAL